MNRYVPLIMILMLAAAGCDVAFGPEPTATPTSAFPDLAPSPTIDIHPPTEIADDGPLFLEGVTNPTAAALPADSAFLPSMPTPDLSNRPILIETVLSSGVSVNGEVWLPGGRAPGVVLFGATFEQWAGFPSQLRQAGYSVVVFQWSRSITADDIAALVNAAALQPGVDPARVILIGAEAGADFALVACAGDSRCLGSVLLSPQSAENADAVMQAYNPRPILLAASEVDSASLRTANTLRQLATGSALLQPFDDAGRGTQILFNRPDMVTLILEFLATVTGTPR
ncbi:MAG: hypothetical protein AELANPGJ_01527 [Anaerolineae bacterium]|nr:MAG: Alpha/beta hydrolase family protein [Chloroflexi bacterium OLB13]MBV6436271.1 hypothetical protein [Anaerolineae bacterium]